MGEQRVYSLTQVAPHKSKTDCWIAVHGKVLNLTQFLVDHPGGEEVLLEVAGKDASKEFDDIGHSLAAKKLLLKYQVGVLQGYRHQVSEAVDDLAAGAAATDIDSSNETKVKEMSAFVIKDPPHSKFKALLEFAVPLVVAVSYFVYAR